MSKSIDQRVVQMEFDNSRFESNVSTTMSTLDKLKEKLKFGNATESLDELEKAGKNFTLDSMANAVDKIAERFTLMGSIGFNAMEKVAKAAVNAGEKIVKSLTVDQMAAGFEKYQAETNAVQAMYSALKRKTKDDGTAYQLEDIYEQLDKVAEYADYTSYSYSQMTESMKRFIAAGVPLKDSERSVEGIANAAALAGISVRDTAIIFRNLSDAISSGKLQAKDWISLEGNIGTEQFRQQIIDTAIAMKKLDAEANVYSEKGKKIGKVTTANFKNMLQYGFATRDVLLETLKLYANTEKELGAEGFEAAKVSQTWQDVMDSVADAASSGWRKVYRTIFGDYQEASKLFTGIADTLVDEVVGPINETLDTLFSVWKDNGGRDAMIEGLKVWWSNIKEVSAIIGDSFYGIFGRNFNWDLKNAGKLLASVTEGIRDAGVALDEWMGGDVGNGKERGLGIYNISKGVASGFDILLQAYGGIGTFFTSIGSKLGPTVDKTIALFSDLGQSVYNLGDRLRKSEFFKKLGERVSKWFDPIISRLPGIVDKIRAFGESVSIFLSTNPVIQRISTSVKNLFDAIIDGMPRAVEGLLKFGESILTTVRNSDEWKWIQKNFNDHVRPILRGIGNFSAKAIQGLADFFNYDTSSMEGSWWDKLKSRFANTIGKIGPWVGEQWDKLKNRYPVLDKLESWWNTSDIGKAIRSFSESFGTSIDRFFGADTSGEGSIFGKIKLRFQRFWDTFGPWLSSSWEKLTKKYPVVKMMTDWFGDTWTKMGKWLQGSKLVEGLKGFYSSFMGVDTSGADNVLEKIAMRFQAGWTTLSGSLKDIWDGLKENHPLVAAISDWASNAWERLQSWWDTSAFASGLKDFGEKVHESLISFFSVDTSGISGVVDKLKARFSAMWDDLGPWFSEKWESIKSKFPSVQAIADFFGNLFGNNKEVQSVQTKKSGTTLGEWIKGAVESIKGVWTTISNFFGGITMTDVTKWVGISYAIVKIIKAFRTISTVMKIGESAKDALDKLGGLFGQIGNLFSEDENKVKLDKKNSRANNLLKMAEALALVSGSIIFLGKMDLREAQQGIIILGGVLVSLMSVQAILNALDGKDGGSRVGKSLRQLATAVAVLSVSMSLLGNMKQGTATQGILLLEALVWSMVGVMRALDGVVTDHAKMSGLLAMAASIVLLMIPMKVIGNMPIGKAIQGMAGVEILIYSLYKVMKSLNNTGNFSNMAGLIAMAGAIVLLLIPMKVIGNMPIGKAIQGMAGVELLILSLRNVMKKLNGVNTGNAKMGGLIAMALSITLLMIPMKIIGGMDILSAVKGLIGVEALIWSMAGVMKVLDGVNISITSSIGMILACIPFIAGIAAFAVACALISGIDPAVVASFALGVAAVGVGIAAVANAAAKLANVKIGGLIKGILAELAAAGILASAMYLFVLGVQQVKDVPADVITAFGASTVLVAAAMSVVATSAKNIGKASLTTLAKGAAAELLAVGDLAAAMFLFIQGLDAVKAYDPELIVAFAAACLGVSLAVSALGAVVAILALIPMSAVLKAALALAGIIVIVGLVVSLASYLVGNSLEGFSESMAGMAGGLVIFSDLIQQADFDKMKQATDSMKTIATGMVEIGTKNYGNFAFFRTQFSLLGSSISQFDSLIFGFDSEHAKTVVADVVAMANSLSGISTVSDVSDTITNIGSAIKLYAQSVNGVTIDEAPDSSQLSAALEAIANMTLPKMDNIVELASYGTEENKTMLNSMALGVTALGTAVSSFSTDMASVDFTNVGKGIGALEQISTINDNVKEIEVTNIGLFGQTIVKSKSGLTDFANNIVLLGDALKQFGKALTGEGILDKVDAGVTALGKFQEIEAALPEVGGLTQWFTGEKDLSELATDLPTLGDGLKEFGKALTVNGLLDDVNQGVAALDKFAEIEAKLPAANGLVQMFKGEQSLSSLSTDLPGLGTALAEFAKPFQALDVNDAKMTAATTILDELVNINKKMPETGGLAQLISGTQDLSSISDDLPGLGTALASFASPFQGLEINRTKMKTATTILSDLASLYDQMPNMGGLAQLFGGTNSFEGFSKELGYLGTGLKEFATNYGNASMPTNMEDILAPIKTMADLAQEMKIYQDVGDGVIVPTTKIQALEEFVNTFDRIKNKIVEIGTSINDAKNKIGFEQFSSFSTPIQDMINSLNTLNTMQINEGAGLKDFTWLTSQLNTAFEDVGEIVTTYGGVNGDFSEFISPITNCFDSIKKAMEQPENMEAPKFAETVSTFYESLSTAFDGGAVSAELIGKMVVTGIAKGIKSEDSKTTVQKGLYYTVMESGSAYMKGHSDEVFNPVGFQLITSVIGGMKKDGSTRIQNAGIGIIDEAARLVSSIAKTKFYNIGKMICQGIAAGINNSSAIAASAAGHMAEQALAKAKNVLGIRSPSKEFARLGEYSSEGYAKGIEKELGVVEKSVEKIRDKAEDVLSEPLGYRDVYTGKWGGTPQPEDNSEAIEELKNGIREDMKKLRNALPSQSSNSGSRGNGGGGGSSAGTGDATGKGIGEAAGKGIGEAATAGNKIADAASKTAISMANVEMSMEDLAILMEQMPELAERCAISYTNAADAMAASMGGPILEDNAEAEALMAEMLALYGLNPDEFILKPVVTPVYDDSYLSDEEIASLTSEEQAPITNDQMTLVGASIIAAIKNCGDQFAAAIGEDTMGNIIDSINQVKQQVESAETAITDLGNRMSDIQVILDSGVLVGALAPGIDAELANYTDHSSRGL